MTEVKAKNSTVRMFVLIVGGFLAIIVLIGAYWLGISSRGVSTETLSSDQSGANTPSTTTVSQGSSLADKMQCAGYKQKIENNLIQTMDSYSFTALHSVSYSPSRNSCLSSEYILYFGSATVASSEILTIDDVLTGQTIWTQSFEPSLKYWDAEQRLDNELSEIN